MAPAVESEGLWKRVGLEELRQALERVTALAGEFEAALKALPPCDACARALLLERIEAAGRRLGGAAISVSTLADVLRQAQATAEHAQQELVRCAPESCACPPGQCSCDHAGRRHC
ncbi:MAG: hypothetical protein HY598_05145 [Candidatus Omnitrophica bacterium]|nr:hypothetical protein [Candidatus Omnitrophota bacterium]